MRLKMNGHDEEWREIGKNLYAWSFGHTVIDPTAHAARRRSAYTAVALAKLT
jgi:hypothetical protein